MTTATSLQIDTEQAIAQLRSLGYTDGEPVYYRTFPPKGVKGKPSKFSLSFPKVPEVQGTEGGLYFVVNGSGHSDQDVKCCKAIFFEHDDRPKDVQRFIWQDKGLPEPTEQTETRKSVHTKYAITGGCSVEDWRELQQDLLEYVDGDRQLKNPSRVMRLAGAWHIQQGEEPIRCNLIYNSGKSYTYQELRASIPRRSPPQPQTKPKPQKRVNTIVGDSKNLADLLHREILPRLSPEQAYNWAGHQFQYRNKTKIEGCCPWHESKSGTAFYADLKDSVWIWRCSGCEIGGGPLEYRHRLKGGDGNPPKKDFADLVKELAHDAGVEVPEFQPSAKTGGEAGKVSGKGEDKPKQPKPSRVARELAETYRPSVAFNIETSNWYKYQHEQPGTWSALSDSELQQVIQTELDVRDDLPDGYSWNFCKGVVELLKGYLGKKLWNQSEGLLPFTNGVFNLNTRELLPHAPGYGFTWCLPRPYSAVGDWSTIDAWLDETTDNKPEMKRILLCWLNAVLKGRADLQKFLHLCGPGGTGKGSFVSLAIALIGEMNVHTSTLEDWNTNRYESSNAFGKRLIVFPDEDKYSGGLSRFKSLTGGDPLRAEEKHKRAFQFRFDGMVMVASNFPIFAGDSSSGMARRMLMTPFNNLVDPSRRRNLLKEFEPELPALTNYLLSIPDDEVTATLLRFENDSPDVTELTWEYRMRTDSIAAWLNECVIHDEYAEASVGDDRDDISTLFGHYYKWTERNGGRPKKSREFSPSLLELCNAILGWVDVSKIKTRTGRIIRGLRLRTPEDIDIPNPIDALSSVDDELVTESASDVTGVTGQDELCDGSQTQLYQRCDGCDGCDGSQQLFINDSEMGESQLEKREKTWQPKPGDRIVIKLPGTKLDGKSGVFRGAAPDPQGILIADILLDDFYQNRRQWSGPVAWLLPNQGGKQSDS